ncbi:MAG: acyl-CoA/acyl-ACP dehydrogenase [Mycobacterium sp.]|nr:acyl-CoA/acyl-ACP dehydrogenase [Mycobacterium sp.]
MDFTAEPEQQAVADVVQSILVRENTWPALVSGGIPALGVPVRLGGDGVGIAEIATALNGIGRHGLISPALCTFGFGVVGLRAMASEEQQDRYLDGVTTGAVLTAALNEPGAALPDRPATRLTDGRLDGTKVAVPYAAQANWMLVTTDSGVAVVSPAAPGMRLTGTPSSAGGQEFTVAFAETPVDGVLAGGTVQRLNQLVTAAVGAYGAGLVAGAVRLTADYVSNRHQFGRPLATFQTVAAQLAEVYITSRTLDLASTSAVWRLAQGRDATDDLDVLAYWLTANAPPAMQTCHHLHGGMGMDITYPMHRYYSAVKDLTRLLGGPARRLDLVGAQCI